MSITAEGFHDPNIYNCDFEIFGRVTDTLFRKYAQKEALQLDIRGWVEYTNHGTVEGQIEGPEIPLKAMVYWLKNVGSPKCKISQAAFSPLRKLHSHKFKTFTIGYHY